MLIASFRKMCEAGGERVGREGEREMASKDRGGLLDCGIGLGYIFIEGKKEREVASTLSMKSCVADICVVHLLIQTLETSGCK